MAHDDRHRGEGSWRSRDDERHEYGRPGERSYDRGYGRDPQDRSPGSHVDYYRGGDRGQSRWGPGDGFEMRDDYRRTDRHADQGQAYGRGRDRDDDYTPEDQAPGYGGVGGSMGAYGESRDSGYGGGLDDAAGSMGGGGAAGPGYDPGFGGPRFDRQDVGSTGTHGAHPVASPYGTAQSGMGGGLPGSFSAGGGMSGSSARAYAIVQEHERQHGQQHSRQQDRQRGSYDHDPHYSDWRRRQIDALDRDYDEYRREHASRFEQEFGSWRERRGQQRQSLSRVTEHMEVVGSDGQHIGAVDKVKGDRIVLTKSDPSAGGHHHSVPCSWVESVDDKVTLNKSAEQAMQAWRDEETNRAMFERQDSGSDGPHILERSFSGTYRDE